MVMTTQESIKPHRPFGLMIAIGVGVLFYSLIPLFFTGYFLLVETHLASMESQWTFGEETVEEIARGGELTGGVTRFDMLVQTILAFVFLTIAILAWRGKPRIMRHILTWSVVIISAVTLFVAIFPTPVGGVSGGSFDGLSRLLQPSVLVFYVLLPLYVVWFLNRASARAFYRGYYLPEELEAVGLLDAKESV
jgi:hypothetical protein